MVKKTFPAQVGLSSSSNIEPAGGTVRTHMEPKHVILFTYACIHTHTRIQLRTCQFFRMDGFRED